MSNGLESTWEEDLGTNSIAHLSWLNNLASHIICQQHSIFIPAEFVKDFQLVGNLLAGAVFKSSGQIT